MKSLSDLVARWREPPPVRANEDYRRGIWGAQQQCADELQRWIEDFPANMVVLLLSETINWRDSNPDDHPIDEVEATKWAQWSSEMNVRALKKMLGVKM